MLSSGDYRSFAWLRPKRDIPTKVFGAADNVMGRVAGSEAAGSGGEAETVAIGEAETAL